jgi:hypothetical protein
MTPELRQQAARAFWLDEDATDDQVQAVMIIAQQKSPPKFILGLDSDRKARDLSTLGSLPVAIAARVLIVYHLAEQRSMMGTFLDALGIKHEDGLIQDDEVKPDPSKIGPAAVQIAQQFPAEQVSLYLNTLLCQDPETWGALEGLPQRSGARSLL